MPRKPNYRFERSERERLKAKKKAERQARKKGLTVDGEPLDESEAPSQAPLSDAPDGDTSPDTPE